MSNTEVKDILKFAHSLDYEDKEYTYHKSYFYFVKYFRDKDELTEQDLVLGANFTYGWMPTILNFKSREFVKSLEILNKAKSSERISTDEILTLKSLINNSLVGVSKLLHFVNPYIYAIWDSRVCYFLLGTSRFSVIQNVDKYWEYLELCDRVIANKNFKNIHSTYESIVNYEVSPFRVVEQIMFINSDTTIAKF
ncbi:hypothetical protein LDJ79_23460 [Vibrio tritonius]|uniref:Uncharacterized protein n=1 Tax=Vibrio tritonius TaxID=1435069 RepID=A0ABS7YW38_9VIBR|nr:hypothetical protein [Vibrio tritonius]MCA2019086.1 hypothetical protein [Vibrio tritonius]